MTDDLDKVIPETKKLELAGSLCTVRRLGTRDLFKLARIFNKIADDFGLDSITSLLDLSEDSPQAGAFAVGAILRIFPLAEDDFYDILASVVAKDAEFIAQLPPVELLRLLKAIVEQEELEELFFEAKGLATVTAAKWRKAKPAPKKTQETPSPESSTS